MEDIRDILFSQVSRSRITACIFSDGDGVLSGVERAAAKAAELGLTVNYAACEGAALMAGDLVMELCGPPKAIAKAEDNLMGLMLKPSGIATAAARFVRAAGDMRIVCGSWKKLPHEIKPLIRDAVTAGGAGVRICEEPMVYLDKNYVEMLGGIQSSLRAAEQLGDRKKVIQIRGKYENGDIVREAFSAVSAGAYIVFVDTGRLSDIRKVCEVLLPALRSWKEEFGYRDVKLAYAGGVSFEQLEELRGLGVDIVGVGRAIIDAPLLDMHMDVVKVESDEDHRHKYDLLDKSELLIQGIRLERGNLNVISDIVAEELGIDPDDVLVIDVRDSSVALDILQKQLDPKVFIGKERAILDRLSRTDGVFISDETRISSRGMLGWIVADEEETTEMFSGLERGQQNTEKIGRLLEKGLPQTCAVNPRANRELLTRPKKAAEPKNIIIVGAGVGGMEAARTGKLCGHNVEVYEKSSTLGGQLNAAGAHDFKADIHGLRDWFIRELKELDVPIYLNSEVTPELVKEQKADVIIFATGASPVMPQSIAGIEKAASAVDVLEGKKTVGESVVVVGGGMVGCETAVDLANHGKKVTLVEALDNILSSDFVPQQHSMMLRDLIEDRKIEVITGHKLVAVTDSGAELESVANGEKKTVSADTTVISVGLKPNPIDVSEFYGLGAQVYKIGSAKKAGNVIDAVGEAFEVVYNLD